MLKGRVDVKFPSHGKVNGNFNLPVSAHFPVKIARTSAVNMQLSGEIREKGIISSIFPGLVEESKGHLIFDVTRKGTWDMPDVCLLYTSPSPRDSCASRMPSSA